MFINVFYFHGCRPTSKHAFVLCKCLLLDFFGIICNFGNEPRLISYIMKANFVIYGTIMASFQQIACPKQVPYKGFSTPKVFTIDYTFQNCGQCTQINTFVFHICQNLLP